jgi:hypothetical protein
MQQGPEVAYDGGAWMMAWVTLTCGRLRAELNPCGDP